MPDGDFFIGSSGTLVGAALETAGYYYQSILLDALIKTNAGTSALVSMGGFLFTLGVAIGIVSIVVTGKYQHAFWCLIGPALFYFSLSGRVATKGVDWTHGWEDRSDAKLRAAVKEGLDDQGKDIEGNYIPRVPSLFAGYNRMVSRSVQSFVKTIDAGKKKMDLKFMVRPMLNSFMSSAVVSDAGFRELIHHALGEKCRDDIKEARKMADMRNGTDERLAAKKRFEEKINSRFVLADLSKQYLRHLSRVYPNIFSMKLITDLQQTTENVMADCHNTQNMDRPECKEPEQSVDDLLVYIRERDEEVKRIVLGITTDGRIKSAEQAARVKQSLDTNFPLTPANVERIEGSFSCLDVWKLVFVGLHLEGKKAVDNAVKQAKDKGLDESEAIAEFRALNISVKEMDQGSMGGENANQARLNAIIKATAKQIFRNETLRGSASAILAEYVPKGIRVNEINMPEESSMEMVERDRILNDQWQERTKAMISAANLPYYQGIALYLLAVFYPFFALLLLIPGKHSGFMLWFMLWLWVKSWDIGFAIVMLLDDVLFSLFVADREALVGTTKQALDPDIPAAIWALREVDPTFQLGTYYSIIAVSLHSIPVISSYLILGSLKGGAGMISAGMDRIASGESGKFGRGTGLGGASGNVMTNPGLMAARLQSQNMEHQEVSKIRGLSGDRRFNKNKLGGDGSRAVFDRHLTPKGPGGRGVEQQIQDWNSTQKKAQFTNNLGGTPDVPFKPK